MTFKKRNVPAIVTLEKNKSQTTVVANSNVYKFTVTQLYRLLSLWRMRIGANFHLRVFLFLHWIVFANNGFWLLTKPFPDLAIVFLMQLKSPFIDTLSAAVVATPVNFSLVVWYHLGMFML